MDAATKSVWFNANKGNIVWMDMEMTGLDIDKDKIMEVSCVVTDSDLNIIAEGPEIIIKQDEDTLLSMNEWCKNQHGETGLTDACRNSDVTVEAAESKILKFIKKHIPERTCPLAGNSIYMDRLFLRKHMPQVDEYLHYRIIDVSTVKELCRRWHIDHYKAMPIKARQHRTLSDIRESIDELKYYRETIFVNK